MGKKEKKPESKREKAAQALPQSPEPGQAEVKKEKKQTVHTDAGFRRRILALAIITGILFLVFIFRLVQFQLVDGGKYRAQAEGKTASAASQSEGTEPGSLGDLARRANP